MVVSIMQVLFDDALNGIANHADLKHIADNLGLSITCYSCKVNRQILDIDELSKWAYMKGDKVLLITDKAIGEERTRDYQASYYGLVDSIGGKSGIITINDTNRRHWIYLALHEILHLHGVKHCENRSCIMAFRMCNCRLKYCVTCAEQCNPLGLCDKCRGDIVV